MKLLIALAFAHFASAQIRGGWRDQHIRIHPHLRTKIIEKGRSLKAENKVRTRREHHSPCCAPHHCRARAAPDHHTPCCAPHHCRARAAPDHHTPCCAPHHCRARASFYSRQDFSDELKAAARNAVKKAEEFHFRRMAEQRRKAQKPAAKDDEPSNRRQALTVEDLGSGTDGKRAIKITTNNNAALEVTHADMSLFDCPWSASLHSYLDVNAPFAVDGGLCLPYQEIPFPYSIGIAPINTTTANIQTPSPGWNPDLAKCFDATGANVLCEYPGDATIHGGPTGIAENYGAAAGNPGWATLAGARARACSRRACRLSSFFVLRKHHHHHASCALLTPLSHTHTHLTSTRARRRRPHLPGGGDADPNL